MCEAERGDDELARQRMDNISWGMIQIYREYQGVATKTPEEMAAKPTDLLHFLEAISGQIMFNQRPAAIVFALAVVTHRYVELLGEKAINGGIGADSEFRAMLQAIMTEEGNEPKSNVTDMTSRLNARQPGMYL